MRKILKRIRRHTRGRRNEFVDPEEIFLDSQNLPDFDTQQFEGQFERPIERRSLLSVGVVFFVIVTLFGFRLWNLQIVHGDTYQKQSENNSLDSEPIFAARGNIYDRNGVPLAWNNTTTDEVPWGQRSYIADGGFSHILGYVGYPAKDKSGNFWQKEIVGKDGIEKMYNTALSGQNGSHIVEKDIAGKVQVGSVVNKPIAGSNITLTIDARLQSKMHAVIVDYAKRYGFNSASAVMMDSRTGDVIVMTSYPEYDSNIMSSGSDRVTIRQYLTSKSTPLLNRAISGLFTPGSIVKPYVGLAALKEGVITPNALLCSCGSITVPNPYDPAHPGVFRDYNPNNGMVDMRRALAVSSNIYFMEVAGGYHAQKGMGIEKLQLALTRFGLTEKTGIDLLGERTGTVPSPEWKAKRFNGEGWRIGDTYNTAIGQYGVQVTPIEMARSLAAIANRGTLLSPHLLKTDVAPVSEKIPDISDAQYTVVHEGMRMGATMGTGKILSTLPFSVASKTGTAQVGASAQYVNAWMNAFFPYENPKYVLVVVMEQGPQLGLGASQPATKDFFDWVVLNAPEYTQ